MTYLLGDDDRRPATIRLPEPPPAPGRSALPLAAAVVPLLGAGVMFAVTRSPFMLWFAALAPLMLAASVIDRTRARRRDARRERGELAAAIDRARAQLTELRTRSRESRWRVHPDLALLCMTPAEVWRNHPEREGVITVGRGEVASGIEVARDDDRPAARDLREDAAVLPDAPVAVPLDGGICVRADGVAAAAVARALLLQLCTVHAPGTWQIVTGDEDPAWVAMLPHAAGSAGRSCALVPPGALPPDADVIITWTPRDGTIPPGVRTLIDLEAGLSGHVRRGAASTTIRAEAISVRQAESLAQALAARAGHFTEGAARTVALADLDTRRSGTLGVAIGRRGTQDAVVDLVDDGPHAVVIGTTGSGKSELLVTWAAALCRTYRSEEVILMLADFKGGTAFTALADVPHVVGVLTDLDGALARRAVRSLEAEVRRREQIIADAGARDVTDPRVRLPRLVVMIDEFPALLAQHPDLDAVFVDIAARGRALGIHLVLGAQRAAGVVRDATLANVPLRIALRTAEPTDSRLIIGTGDAARIPGGVLGRGIAYVRRAGDDGPERVRIALTAAPDLACTSGERAVPPDDRPWLPPLPRVLPVRQVPNGRGAALGLADDPSTSAQHRVSWERSDRGLLVVGKPRSGKSNVIELLAQQIVGAVRLDRDPETAWDQLLALENATDTTVLCDDLDVLVAAWPEPWGSEGIQRWEQVIRRGGSTGVQVVATLQRGGGPLQRICDLLPRRALLALSHRTDHLIAGGEPGDFVADRPVGRALLDGRETQFALADRSGGAASRDETPAWKPVTELAGLVTRGGAERAAQAALRCGRVALPVADAMGGAGDGVAWRDVLLYGDGEQWQRSWALVERVRREGELAVASECLAELRALTGDRSLPPYARPGRLWVVRAGQPVLRRDVP